MKNSIILADDKIKGKGISFMENNGLWHRNIPTEEQYNRAKKELEARIGEKYEQTI